MSPLTPEEPELAVAIVMEPSRPKSRRRSSHSRRRPCYPRRNSSSTAAAAAAAAACQHHASRRSAALLSPVVFQPSRSRPRRPGVAIVPRDGRSSCKDASVARVHRRRPVPLPADPARVMDIVQSPPLLVARLHRKHSPVAPRSRRLRRCRRWSSPSSPPRRCCHPPRSGKSHPPPRSESKRPRTPRLAHVAASWRSPSWSPVVRHAARHGRPSPRRHPRWTRRHPRPLLPSPMPAVSVSAPPAAL